MGRYITTGLLLLLVAVAFPGCRENPFSETVPPKTVFEETTVPGVTPAPEDTESVPTDVSPRGQLMALVETQEEARKLAELYGIELVEYGEQVALFHTEEDPQTVIQRGVENGWPELSLNRPAHAF